MKINRLLTNGPDWWHNAFIDNNDPLKNKWNSYAVGYKVAGEILIKQVLEASGRRDTLIFPMVFLYRHFLELRLKEIIEHGSRLLDEEYKIPKHHDLMIIWTEAKKVILKIWPESSPKSLKHIDSVLTDFVNVDKMSDCFRYPVDTSGIPTLQGFSEINIENFVEAITPVIEDLEGMSIAINFFEKHKEEIRSYYDDYLSSFT